MFIVLLPIYFKSITAWKEAVPLCTYMICATAIILTLIILHFSIYKNHLKKIAELEKSNKMAEITRENYRATPCSNYSSNNNTDCAKESNNKSEKETKPKEHKS